MTDPADSKREEVNALEDACLGVALLLDEKASDDPETEAPGADNPFMQIVTQVLNLRVENEDLETRHAELTDQWETITRSLDLPSGSFEKFAQRGAGFGDELRNPTFDETTDDGELVAIAETDSGRTIWGVNAGGWDDDVFEQDDVTLGMTPDGSIEPVTVAEESDSESESDNGE